MSLQAISAIKQILASGRFDMTDEIVCQQQIEKHLLSLGASFEKEYRLNDGIVDFFFPKTGLALEIKVAKKWGKIKVYRQCERYCKDDRVNALVLATGRAQRLPETINDKPVAVFYLGATNL